LQLSPLPRTEAPRLREAPWHHLAGTPACLVETGLANFRERTAQPGANVTLLASMSAEGMGQCLEQSPLPRSSRDTS
jgi:hypothetical protein